VKAEFFDFYTLEEFQEFHESLIELKCKLSEEYTVEDELEA
jgi:hypothetical protein